jgi:predicted metal-dependent phosphotriesterase family hydrolase
MMTTEVMTVTGPVPVDQIGVTIMHEHLFINLHRVSMNDDSILRDPVLAILEAGHFREAGGRTIVDVTSGGMDRKPAELRRVAQEAGVNVIMGCGWYKERYFSPEVYEKSTNQLAADMIHDIEVGADGTDVRAGIIGEVGSLGSYIQPSEERVLRAAARAHKRTGLTVTTHAVGSTIGLDQLDILEEEGVDLRRVIIGHCDSYPYPDYHEAIAKRGAYVEFDRIQGKVKFETVRRAGLVKELADRGHLRKILLSQDICEKSSLKAYGGQGYSFVLTGFVPFLLDAGLSQEEIQILLVENPRAALTGGE